MDVLVKFFNALFNRGIYPDSWTESIILPVFKKSNQNDPNNYRGISLCDTSSKLYSSIINNRIQEWIERNNLTGECQACFKKDYSTVAIIQKEFTLNRKLYVAFIDFEKAFERYRGNYFGLFFSKMTLRVDFINALEVCMKM